MATVAIPQLLCNLTGGARTAEVPGATLGEIVAALDRLFPGFEARVHQGGQMSPTLAFTVDGRIALQGLATPVGPQSQVHILPAMGGG
jgi:molybdopterin synthase sulfur carrier subunit